jgi:serine/threonine-protein kinase RsbW
LLIFRPEADSYSSLREKKMPINLNERAVKLILPNAVGYERIAMASLASYAKMYGFAPDRIEDLKTVVAEAAINAMEHGNQGRPDAVVNIAFHYCDDAIQIMVADQGEGIKKILPNPDIERIVSEIDPPVGFGLYLIRQLANEVEFNINVDSGHCLRMVIKKEQV